MVSPDLVCECPCGCQKAAEGGTMHSGYFCRECVDCAERRERVEAARKHLAYLEAKRLAPPA